MSEGSGGSVGTMFAFFGVLFLIFFVSSMLISLFRRAQSKRKASQLGDKSRFPQTPEWLANQIDLVKFLPSKDRNPFFEVYTKNVSPVFYAVHNGSEKRPTIKMMRKFLEENLGVELKPTDLPDTTCIISIRKRNFKFGSRPGEFLPKHGWTENSSFIYQMAGDSRILITSYIARGTSYVAGITVFIENPLEETVHYDRNLMKEMLNEQDYWLNSNLKNEGMDLVKRKTDGLAMILTKNRYQESKIWNYNLENKRFEDSGESQNREYLLHEDSKTESRSLSLKFCEKRNEIMMISNKSGHSKHAIWNENSQKFEFFQCDFCDLPEEAPPPSYSSLKRNW